MVAVVRHGDRFGEPLCFVVDAARADRIHVAPVAFRLRAHVRIAVTFRRGRHQKFRFFRESQAQAVVRAERADLQSLNGKFQVIGRACGRREMQNGVNRDRQLRCKRETS